MQAYKVTANPICTERGDAIRAGLAKKLFANARNLKRGELAALVGRLSSCRVWIESNG